MSFKNKVVLITGASSGIGAATAIKFAENAANISMVGRNSTKLKNVSTKCEEAGAKTLVIIADVTKDEDITRIVNETVTYFNRIDVLVNNAGIIHKESIFAENVIDVFDRMISTNLRSAVYITNLLANHLVESKGCIVNIGSIGGNACMMSEKFSYGVAKAGLECFTKNSAIEFGSKGVRVNIVLPGPTRTDCMNSMGISQEEEEHFWSILNQNTLLGKISEAEEVADVVVFLASDKAKSITGSSYVIDNGMLLRGLMK